VRGREDGEKKKERVDLGVTDDVWWLKLKEENINKLHIIN
jgi:hypothetical protein